MERGGTGPRSHEDTKDHKKVVGTKIDHVASGLSPTRARRPQGAALQTDRLTLTALTSGEVAMRVLIVDDHQLVAEGLTNLLAAHGIEVVGTARDGWEAVEPGAKTQPGRHPDGRPDAAAAMGWPPRDLITAQMPEVRIVMLTTSAEDEDLFEAVRSGACGYLLKSMSGQQFIESLAGLEQGVPPFSPGLAGRILGEFARQSGQGSGAVPGPEKGAPTGARQLRG